MQSSKTPYTLKDVKQVVADGRSFFRPVVWFLVVANVVFAGLNLLAPSLLLDSGWQFEARQYYFDAALRVQGSAIAGHVFTPEFEQEIAHLLPLNESVPPNPMARTSIDYSVGERLLRLKYRSPNREDPFLQLVIPLVNQRIFELFTGPLSLDRAVFAGDGFAAGTLPFEVSAELANLPALTQLLTLEQYIRLFEAYKSRPDASGTAGTNERWIRQLLQNSELRQDGYREEYLQFASDSGLTASEAVLYLEYRKQVAWESLYFSVGSSVLAPDFSGFPNDVAVTALGLGVWELVVIAVATNLFVLIAVLFLVVVLKLYREAGSGS